MSSAVALQIAKDVTISKQLFRKEIPGQDSSQSGDAAQARNDESTQKRSRGTSKEGRSVDRKYSNPK